MKCDIITPVYNRPELLQRGIESVLNQTSPNWEHWIYDDGSDFDIELIVTEYDDERIHFIQGPKRTTAERFGNVFTATIAKDILLKKSSNELIAYLDDDDYFWPEAIEVAINYFEKFPERFVIYGKLTYSDKNTENVPREKRKFRMFKHGLLNISQVIHRRECLKCWHLSDLMLDSEYPFHRSLIKEYEFFPVDFFLVNKWHHPFNMLRLRNTGKEAQRRRE